MRASSRQACPSSPRPTWAPRWPLQLLPLLPGPVLCVEGLARVVSRDDLPVERALRRERSRSDAGLAAGHPSNSSEEGRPTPPALQHMPHKAGASRCSGTEPGREGALCSVRLRGPRAQHHVGGDAGTEVQWPSAVPTGFLVTEGWSAAQPCPVRSGLPGPAPPSGGPGVHRAGRRAAGRGSGAARAQTTPRRGSSGSSGPRRRRRCPPRHPLCRASRTGAPSHTCTQTHRSVPTARLGLQVHPGEAKMPSMAGVCQAQLSGLTPSVAWTWRGGSLTSVNKTQTCVPAPQVCR